jgi:hypothetical protein
VHVSEEAQETLQPEIDSRVEPGSTIKTDGVATSGTLEEIGVDHEQRVSAHAEGDAAAVETLPWMPLDALGCPGLRATCSGGWNGVHSTYASGLLERSIALFEHRFAFRSDL